MSIPSSQPEKKPEAKNLSQLFDDALPEKLKYEGVVKEPLNAPRIHKNTDVPLSPYIIQLQCEKTEQATTSRIDALAQQLMEEARELGDDLQTEEDDLQIDFQDLVSQLREPDRIVTSGEVPRAKKAQTQQEKPFSVAPAGVSLPEDIYDLVEEECETPAPAKETKRSFADAQDGGVVRAKISWRLSLPKLSSHTRAFAMFTLLSFALVLPLHAMQSVTSLKQQGSEITDVGAAAIDSFFQGTNALNEARFDLAESEFARANQTFAEAETSLKSMNATIGGLVQILPETDKTYDSVRGLLTAGKELSAAAESMAAAADEIESQTSLNVVTKLSILDTYVEQAQPSIAEATEALEQVDPDVLPEEYQDTVVELQQTVPQLSLSLNEYLEFSETLAMVLGKNRKMRYLVTFQNNTEIRPTGGFTGSFAELDLLNGEIDSMYVPEGGTYDLQGQLTEFVASPHPLSLLDPRWEFHDANYFPDYPTSAKKMIWFYEHAGGPTVDGVISINATFMPELLAILGPVDMPEYGRSIDSENFLFETQKIVEIEYETYQINDEEREVEAPKQFIGDLAPKILEKLEEADTETMLAVLDLLGNGLEEKDVMLYFDNNSLQSTIEELGWSGRVKQAPDDYLMVVNTNLGGGKTDTVIDQDVYIDTVVEEDGSIVNTVTITKDHKGLTSSLFEGENNVDYIRLYVPRGSELISASGFEIPDDDLFELSDLPLNYDEDLALLMSDIRKDPETKTDIWVESGKTVFGNWMQTKPGELETVTFSYRLPFSLEQKDTRATLFEMAKERLGFKDLESYSLFVQKQPGVITRETHVTLSLPEQKSIIWSSHNASKTTISNEIDEFIQYVIETN